MFVSNFISLNRVTREVSLIMKSKQNSLQKKKSSNRKKHSKNECNCIWVLLSNLQRKHHKNNSKINETQTDNNLEEAAILTSSAIPENTQAVKTLTSTRKSTGKSRISRIQKLVVQFHF